jgi:hypothetical protein
MRRNWWRLELVRRPAAQQQLLPFQSRIEALHRRFKRLISIFTCIAIAAIVGGTATGRHTAASLVEWFKQGARKAIGLEATDAERDAQRLARRQRTTEATSQALDRYYRTAPPEMRQLFDVTGMDPQTGLIGSGRASNGFLLSSKVFAKDDHGRSYRLRPNTRSVWLRQVTLQKGPFGLFLVPDTPEVRRAAGTAGAIVDELSRQTTNSWGLRGPEPNPSAPLRGIVLGDSFMLGMFNGDNDTPPLYLEREMSARWERPVSILNTGHIGYAPEQYYFSLREYGPRFQPHFVVVSVCPNDFGDDWDVISGKGDDWDEATQWLEAIVVWCHSQMIPCLLVTVPCNVQIDGNRKDANYPGRISNLFRGGGFSYLNPLDIFIDEHLRLMREGEQRSNRPRSSPLYNGHIADNHFSPAGAALWAKTVCNRLSYLITLRGDRPKTAQAALSARALPGGH